ncbi:MAG: 2-oxoglutarate dehydrogenase E1 component [Phycisphaerales bacterium]|nr:2-oxoglutarate dehydrogenase E1 component [Phycisphaerales bacterium]
MPENLDLPNQSNLPYVEELYEEYLSDPNAVEPRWRDYFRQFSNGSRTIRPSFQPGSIFHGGNGVSAPVSSAKTAEALQDRLDQLVRAYRVRGHMAALLDPLGRPRPEPLELAPSFYGFTEADMSRLFSARTIGGLDVCALGEIVQRLRNTYCRSIGVQFMHIDEFDVRTWLQERMEGSQNRCTLTRDQQTRILTRLTDAVMFEEFLQTKYVGAKSFSLEGGESLIPLLDMAIEDAAEHGIEEIVIGMAHRGRLNVLANILGKSPRKIFEEFEDKNAEANLGRGDVKYHLGYHRDWTTANGKSIHLALCFNPSHLEYVNPVALGRLRAKQDRAKDYERRQGMCLLIHGDAAFAGEGIVQETLNLSELSGYRTGGTLHVIVNNQIGFTTDPQDSRSSIYASGLAKMLQIPLLHVNGEDPEAVAQCVRLALDFRAKFQRDVVIDMYCFRRRGHNEGDEPSFTQPMLYKAIRERKPVRESYLDHLLTLGDMTREEAEQIKDSRKAHLEEELQIVRTEGAVAASRPSLLGKLWAKYLGGHETKAPDVDTGAPIDLLKKTLTTLASVPDGFTPHRTMLRFLENRNKMVAGEEPLDWSAAEALALATIALGGVRVRLSGQDSERGTFSHRHAVLHDFETGARHMALEHLSPDQAPVDIFNSPLSEAGVLGFEYGFSVAYPDGLVMWEAQFGDFANVAQVIIDQFIASAEDKWHSLSGLVMLLPHGFEGQGPEHSSARIERFLQLSAEDNIIVCQPTTPAQMFHLLRRQVLRKWRKPLVVMTPKSLLRNKHCVSTFEDLTKGTFQRILPDPSVSPDKTSRVLLCSGKIYYDLVEARAERKRDDVAIIRVEQIYPLHRDFVEAALKPYKDDTPVFWVQDEPENMGPWHHLLVKWGRRLLGRFPLNGIYRRASASPATGSAGAHKLEQAMLMRHAFGDTES